MDRNIVILVTLVFLYVISVTISDKIQMGDCQEELIAMKGTAILDTEVCCKCALDEIKKTEFKILDVQIKTNGITGLLTTEDPLLEKFDVALTACVKNKSDQAFAFSNQQKDSLQVACREEYRGTPFEKEIDLTKYCGCFIETSQATISVRELLKREINFSGDRAINDKCIIQSKITIDTIQQ